LNKKLFLSLQKLFFYIDSKYYPSSVTLPEEYEDILKGRLKLQNNADSVLLKEKDIIQSYLNKNIKFKKILKYFIVIRQKNLLKKFMMVTLKMVKNLFK
jgi:hypothetical protein